MKTKKHYAQPSIKTIGIDKEISLALESPPCGPGECNNQLHNNNTNNPYKSMG